MLLISLLRVPVASVIYQYWTLFLLMVKGKILFRFLSGEKNRCECRSFVTTKWHNMNSQNEGHTCITTRSDTLLPSELTS